MGLRNPYRIWVDKSQQRPLLGRGRAPTPERRSPTGARRPTTSTTGPPGPGNYGWPYCGGPNVAYNDWDFAANAPAAGSPAAAHRPGQQLAPQHRPAAAPADPRARWSGSSTAAASSGPRLDNPGGCGSPNHAEVYHYNPNLVSDVKWPQYYDNKLLITEYCRNWIKGIQFDNGNPATGNPTIIEPTLAGMQFVHPIDMEFGPDGSLYMLEYGNGYFSGDAAPGLYKINYVAGGRSPIAVASANRDNGLATADGDLLQRRQLRPGRQPAHLPVGLRQQRHHRLDRGEPVVHLHHQRRQAGPADRQRRHRPAPARRSWRSWSATTGRSSTSRRAGRRRPVRLERQPHVTATATDAQDGTIACANVVIRAALGHQEHAHEEGPGDRLRLHHQHRPGPRRPRLGAVLRAARRATPTTARPGRCR